MPGRRIEIRGVVQGVGFRPWIVRLARQEGISGRVQNDAAGVTIEAFGPLSSLTAFRRRLAAEPPPAAAIREIDERAIPGEEAGEFTIVASQSARERRISIPPDLATCDDCLEEVSDPADRRYRYAFTNCTNCGPRFTIASDVPYDRPATTMAAFRMCPDCRGEYESLEDRRYHAQPNACPRCGPSLRLLTAGGDETANRDPLRSAAAALRAGRIVAVKGLGGFHLACDATTSSVVRRLRRRKRRPAKPFAVMVDGIATAARLARVSDTEARLLASTERPIVLLRRRRGGGLAEEVAPDNPLVGLLLPYTPLHHLLMDAVERPLVMTSGNLSGEPIVCRNDDAVDRLGRIADFLLVHDREIGIRCDDSVVRVVGDGPVWFRRSRGRVPRPIPVEHPFRRPVLACGPQLKNTVCVGLGDAAYLGPHVGDLDGPDSGSAFEESIRHLTRLLETRPEVVAHDLHPGYLSTSYALERAGVETVGVQHHHAHVVSAMAEHGLHGPVIGVAYDGTGYGPDGTVWGGEILLADAAGYRRVATFRPLPLPGGEAAIREPWRMALALLDDAFDGAPSSPDPSWLRRVGDDRVRVIRRMIERNLNCPRARGVGRYFDALGALVLGRGRSRFEGEVAMLWNFAADHSVRASYPFTLDRGRRPWVIDLRPLVRDAVDDLGRGRPAGEISGKFHNALVDATAAVVAAATRRVGRLPVVLTGGCFQNDLLSDRLLRRLRPEHEVRVHREVPPGDGGIALGQAVVANARVEGTGGALPCV